MVILYKHAFFNTYALVRGSLLDRFLLLLPLAADASPVKASISMAPMRRALMNVPAYVEQSKDIQNSLLFPYLLWKCAFSKVFFFLSYSHMSNFLETSSAEKVKTVLSGSEWHKMTTDGQRSPFSNLSRLFVLSNLAAAGSSVHPRDRINLCDDVIPRTSCNVQDEQIKIKKKQDTRYF